MPRATQVSTQPRCPGHAGERGPRSPGHASERQPRCPGHAGERGPRCPVHPSQRRKGPYVRVAFRRERRLLGERRSSTQLRAPADERFTAIADGWNIMAAACGRTGPLFAGAMTSTNHRHTCPDGHRQRFALPFPPEDERFSAIAVRQVFTCGIRLDGIVNLLGLPIRKNSRRSESNKLWT